MTEDWNGEVGMRKAEIKVWRRGKVQGLKTVSPNLNPAFGVEARSAKPQTLNLEP